jgi:hypothetical protein
MSDEDTVSAFKDMKRNVVKVIIASDENAALAYFSA